MYISPWLHLCTRTLRGKKGFSRDNLFLLHYQVMYALVRTCRVIIACGVCATTVQLGAAQSVSLLFVIGDQLSFSHPFSLIM